VKAVRVHAFGELYFRRDGFFDPSDLDFVPLVEGPFLDPFRARESGLTQDLHVLARCRLAHTQLA